MTLEIKVTSDVETCLDIRREVFVDEQNVPLQEEIDDLDGEAQHVLAFVDGAPIGTARIFYAGDTLKIGRVAVRKSHRGAGIGAALILHAVEMAQAASDISRAYLSAQTHALGFYERLGFRAYGDVYDDAGIPHQDMERLL